MFLPVQWLFFAASTYVWVQYVWHTGRFTFFRAETSDRRNIESLSNYFHIRKRHLPSDRVTLVPLCLHRGLSEAEDPENDWLLSALCRPLHRLSHGHARLRLQKLPELQTAPQKTEGNPKAERVPHSAHCQGPAPRTPDKRQREIQTYVETY